MAHGQRTRVFYGDVSTVHLPTVHCTPANEKQRLKLNGATPCHFQ